MVNHQLTTDVDLDAIRTYEPVPVAHGWNHAHCGHVL